MYGSIHGANSCRCDSLEEDGLSQQYSPRCRGTLGGAASIKTGVASPGGAEWNWRCPGLCRTFSNLTLVLACMRFAAALGGLAPGRTTNLASVLTYDLPTISPQLRTVSGRASRISAQPEPVAGDETQDRWILAQMQFQPVSRSFTASSGSVDTVPNGFFLDIRNDCSGSAHGHVVSGGTSPMRMLEERGWVGACVGMCPSSFVGRHCKVQVRPIGPRSGERVRVRQCDEDHANGAQFANGTIAAPCPEVELETLGVADLLSSLGSPSVVDLALLGGGGSATSWVATLEAFPFTKTCVRAWMVRHDDQAIVRRRIRNVLEQTGVCEVRDRSGGHLWASCSCSASPS
eukprot:TRINITY_DN12217_c0_g1_i1.p1 TRINITY_DN12217_c0_g1~~TRINITY_DN12217_c0_g1_i1.p1  ORF type:complete len:346 (+),score=47.94 TRINITY_DN12217_c0_g1_i1:209-1246(+)